MSEKVSSTIFVDGINSAFNSRPVDYTGEFKIIVSGFDTVYEDPATIIFERISDESKTSALPDVPSLPGGRHRAAGLHEAEELDTLPAPVHEPTIGEKISTRKNALICASMATCIIALTGIAGSHIQRTNEAVRTSLDTRHPAVSGMSWLALQNTLNISMTKAPLSFIPAESTPPVEAPVSKHLDPDTYQLVGADNIQKAFNYLVDIKDVPEEQAAALIGNWKVESPGLNPETVEGFTSAKTIPPKGGYGIAQWTKQSRKKAFADFALLQPEPRNTPADFRTQMDFAVKELNTTHKGALDDMNNKVVLDKRHTRAYNDSLVVLTKYEAPQEHAINGNNARIRGAYADQIIATMHLWAEKFKHDAHK